jgi:S1/P1 Nuclease
MRRYRPVVLVALVCVLASGRLWAWGCTGHETVALIALKDLQALDAANQTQIAQQVETLLSAQTHAYTGRFCKDLGLDPIAYFATWADDHRAVDPSTGNWHYWDIPLHVKSAVLGEYCDGGCVVQALQDQIAILHDKSKDDAARSTALLYILHFAGDMHQPLHEEDNNDRGGNCVPVQFLNTNPRATSGGSYSPNLHAVWDTQLVETIGQITRSGSDAKSQIEAFASRLETQHASDAQPVFHDSADLVAWANEAHAIARADPYAKLQPHIGAARKTAPVTACSDAGTSTKYLKKHETVSQAYITAVQADVEGQLSRAGQRLAAILYATLK